MRDFKILYNGKEETVTIDDEPDTDTVLRIAEYGFDWSQGSPRVKPREMPMTTILNLVKKAPWPITPDVVVKLPAKVSKQILDEIKKSMDIESFLSLAIDLLSVKKPNEPVKGRESSISLPPGESHLQA